MWPRVTDQRLFAGVMMALIACAWLALWVWGQSPYGRFLSHERLGDVSGGSDAPILMIVLVAGWALMTVAMMLPTSLPLVALFHTLVQRRPDAKRLVTVLIAGYLSVWVLFGLLVHLGDWALHEAIDRIPWLEANARMLGAAILVLAGIYQFTPLKYRCLDKCRSPLTFIMEHWQGSQEHAQAFRLGVRHGTFCVGCCWSLMLLMFAVGIGNLGWMLMLGTVMAVEKNMPWGRRISAPLGGVLLAWGFALVFMALPGANF